MTGPSSHVGCPPTDPTTGQPLWAGLPVPWAARWSGERREGGHGLASTLVHGRLHIAYAQPDPADHPLGVAAGFAAQRDELGLLWLRDAPHGQGVGEPQFATLHAGRQRQAMLQRRCQVCGGQFAAGQPVTFLLASSEPRRFGAGTGFLTSTAPTCPRCVPVAMRLCPAQRRSSRVLVHAHTYRPAGVIGDLYVMDATSGRGALEVAGRRLALGDPDLSRAMAKQLYVRIGEHTVQAVAAHSADGGRDRADRAVAGDRGERGTAHAVLPAREVTDPGHIRR